jgi:RNA polymerase sigma-70 factor (ECF subfamily)
VALSRKTTSSPEKKSPDPWDQEQWVSWEKLMVKIQAGDQEGYRQFLDEIGPVLFNFVRRRVFNQELVPDVYQEVLLTLHKARHSYEPGRPLGPWLFTVARNSMLDAMKRNRRFAEREVPSEILPEVVREEEDSSLGDELHQALKGLPEDNRVAVELLKIKGMSLEDAANQLGITVGALKVRAHRGYKELRRILTEKKP